VEQASRLEWRRFSETASELFERYMVPAIFQPWAIDLVLRTSLQPGERVLDVACGTGVVAREAAWRVGPGGTVVGLDLSPGMLATARARAADAAIEWREGSAVAMPLPSGAFDVVFCQQGLQFFPDRPAALHEMRRVLVAGGRLALSVFRASAGHFAVADACTPHIGPAAAGSIREPFTLPERSVLLSLLAGAGFGDLVIDVAVRTAHFPTPDAFVEFLMAGRMAGAVATLGDDARAALLEDVRIALRPYRDGDGLAFPMESHVAVART
jgi:SAM-dependent methyltransferase